MNRTFPCQVESLKGLQSRSTRCPPTRSARCLLDLSGHATSMPSAARPADDALGQYCGCRAAVNTKWPRRRRADLASPGQVRRTGLAPPAADDLVHLARRRADQRIQLGQRPRPSGCRCTRGNWFVQFRASELRVLRAQCRSGSARLAPAGCPRRRASRCCPPLPAGSARTGRCRARRAGRRQPISSRMPQHRAERPDQAVRPCPGPPARSAHRFSGRVAGNLTRRLKRELGPDFDDRNDSISASFTAEMMMRFSRCPAVAREQRLNGLVPEPVPQLGLVPLGCKPRR